MKTLTVPERHQLKIARDTLKMNDIGARIMGGMTKDEARDVILRLTGRAAVETAEPKSSPSRDSLSRDLSSVIGYSLDGKFHSTQEGPVWNGLLADMSPTQEIIEGWGETGAVTLDDVLNSEIAASGTALTLPDGRSLEVYAEKRASFSEPKDRGGETVVTQEIITKALSAPILGGSLDGEFYRSLGSSVTETWQSHLGAPAHSPAPAQGSWDIGVQDILNSTISPEGDALILGNGKKLELFVEERVRFSPGQSLRKLPTPGVAQQVAHGHGIA